ncbi:LptF/LptG family permease [Aquimarina brevivitae]|uniref:LptF/LptG family permease n=1 Tax=Aquimarina brevivitae TaxID=323412 RepID=UPI0010289801|nr:LptF/LptG family permease [Aquimarina brevivitae]
MKILDRYILTSFLKTFFPLFIIIMFILLLQTIWLFISELAGKDLDLGVILKFLTFALPRLVPMVLPLTVLLTSIMTFGNFAENYEFAAMKSSGISLQRAMRYLAVLIFFTAIGAFWFSNTIMPESEKRFINLRKNIFKLKPAMVITPNQFNDLGDINIKVAEKSGDKGQYLEDIIIHKKSNRPGNYVVIKAVEGELKGSPDSEFVTLVLKDGNYYEDIQQKSPQKRNKLPFAKVEFEEYILNMDLSSLDEVDLDAQQTNKGYNMLNVVELQQELDTFSSKVNTDLASLRDDVNRRSGFENLNRNMKIDSVKSKKSDSLQFSEIFDTKQMLQIYSLAFTNTDGVVRKIKSQEETIKFFKRGLNKYEMSLHNKYALGISCIILFFVGAPLGAIIRKGGMGLPIVIGVVLFLTYHFIGIFAKNSAEEGGLPPFLGSWLSTFIMLPLSIFLTYRATTDQGIFSLANFTQPIKDFFSKRAEKIVAKSKARRRKKMMKGIETVSTDDTVYVILKDFEDAKLKDIVTNFEQYDYKENYKFTALKILEERGITMEVLEARGELDNQSYEQATNCYQNFTKFAALMIFLYLISLLINIVIKIVVKDASDETSVLLGIFNLVFNLSYLVLFIITAINFENFYKLLKERVEKSTLLFYLLGFFFFPLCYSYFKKQMKIDLKSVR